MKFGVLEAFVQIKTRFEEKLDPGMKNPILGPSSFEDSGDTVRSARLKWGQWC